MEIQNAHDLKHKITDIGNVWFSFQKCWDIKYLQILAMMWLKAFFAVLILIWSLFINIFWYLLAEFCLTRPPIRQNVSKRLEDGQSSAAFEFCTSFYLNHIGFEAFKIVSKIF